MRKLGKLDDGSWICQLSADEVNRLQRREGARKNRAQCIASLSVILTNIERTYGLPCGSVCVINPDTKKPYRRDARIKTIRRKSED